MGLKAIVESLDEVPEALRGEYEEVEGKFRLKVEGAEEAFASGLKKNADKLLKENKQFKDKLASLKEFEGFDLEKVRKGLELIEAQERGQGGSNGSGNGNADNRETVDALLKKRDAEWEKKLNAERERADKTEAELRKYKLDLVVKEAALKAGLRPERVDYAMRINSHRFDLSEEGKPVVLDADGDPISMSLETFWKDDWKSGNEDFYVGLNAGGSGAQAGIRNGSRGGAIDPKLPPAERLKLARRRESATR